MLKGKKVLKGVILIITGLMIIPGLSLAQHDVYLQIPNTVPTYCQEDNIWCGAATCQMLLEGYPGGVEHPFPQADIWDTIQVYKDDPGVSWATDPDGLREALMVFGGDPGVNWAIHTNANEQNLMHSVAYWMTRRSYPTAVLVYGWQHWIAIVGFTTDVDPVSNTTVTLQSIEIHDPWNPPCPTATSGGVKSFMTGINWFNNYWYTPGNYPASKWDGNYIAIIEPPLKDGRATAREAVTKGEIINEKNALELAARWIKELKLYEKQPYAVLRKIKPLKPLLVNQEQKGYYIIPYGYRDGGYAEAAIILNAYNGDFQEVGVFEKPFKYLTEEDAAHYAIDYLCLCGGKAEAQMVFEPSEQTSSRFLPVWKMKVSKRRWIFFKKTAYAFVNQEGLAFKEFTILPLGD